MDNPITPKDIQAQHVKADRASHLPTDAAERKALPIFSGVLRYFPDALAEVARVSKAGNDQHHPGTPLHWDKSKSTDEGDALIRHQLEAGTIDTDGQRHSAKVAWRALAQVPRVFLGQIAGVKGVTILRGTEIEVTSGRPVIYNNLGQSVRRPGDWQRHMARVSETAAQGIRAYPLCSPNTTTQTFNMKNTQVFRGAPTWHPILLASEDEKLRAYADPAVRAKLHEEMVEWKVEIPGNTISREWYNYIWVETPVLEKNNWMKGKTIAELAKAQNKGIIDAFLDLVVEEKLETVFMQAENNIDLDAMREILNFPNALIGLSDGGAHVQYHGGYGFSTRLLGEWVREKQVMSVEQAVRRLTFDSASTFGLYDRGLLRPGMTADITIFDPDTVKPLPEYIVHDFPAGGWRFKEPAAGIYATFVNGRMLMKEGEHTGNLPGRVLRNSRYQQRA